MYKCLKALFDYDREIRWLNVGDGRYGTDANALLKLGASNVMATDISDKLLEIGYQEGFIKEYSAQNAEKLNFKNNQFGFVLCKEAYRHFPRPHIALHEMLRTSNLGVILMKPLGPTIAPNFINRLLPLIKKLLGKQTTNIGDYFKPVGNSVF